MKAYKIPQGKQHGSPLQADGYNMLAPTLLKDGSWCFLENHVNHMKTFYAKSKPLALWETQQKRDIVWKMIEYVESLETVEITQDNLFPIEKYRKNELALDEKTLVESFLKEIIPANKYDENKPLKQLYTDIQAKAIPKQL